MHPQIQALRLHARHVLRDLIWLLANRHEAGDRPNIAVFGSRRSGSTLLMQMIAANRGVKYVDQPCSLFTASAYQLRRLPVRDCGQLHHLDDDEQAMLEAYIQAIETGRLHVNEPWRLWRRDFDWRSNRIVYKFTDAHGMAPWLADRFGWQVVVLTRHPLSQSLSVLNLKNDPGGWHSRAPGFFRSEAYCREFLDDRQVALAFDTWRRGDELERHVLGWVLENLPLQHALRKHPEWHFVSYEGMVIAPEDVVAGMAETCGLADVDAMRARLTRASTSVRRLSSKDRHAAIAAGDRRALLASWRRKVDAETERRTFALIEAFGVDFYACGRDVPRDLFRLPALPATTAPLVAEATC